MAEAGGVSARIDRVARKFHRAAWLIPWLTLGVASLTGVCVFDFLNPVLSAIEAPPHPPASLKEKADLANAGLMWGASMIFVVLALCGMIGMSAATFLFWRPSWRQAPRWHLASLAVVLFVSAAYVTYEVVADPNPALDVTAPDDQRQVLGRPIDTATGIGNSMCLIAALFLTAAVSKLLLSVNTDRQPSGAALRRMSRAARQHRRLITISAMALVAGVLEITALYRMRAALAGEDAALFRELGAFHAAFWGAGFSVGLAAIYLIGVWSFASSEPPPGADLEPAESGRDAPRGRAGQVGDFLTTLSPLITALLVQPLLDALARLAG
jgi:hypothetical protein